MLPIAPGAAAVVLLFGTAGLHAQQEPPKDPPKVDKEFAERLKQASKELNAQQKVRDIQNQALQNLRQVGLALFKFNAEYGGFPNEKTVVTLKEKRGIKAELAAATANDCFLQLVAAQLIEDPKYFTFEKPDPPEAHEGHDHHHHHHDVDKCSFALVSLPDASGNPLQPLAVGPLVKGKTTFDPGPLGGSAVILRLDNSVVLAPIDKEGRVMLEGKDLFDPEQSFWKDGVPPIKWPKD
ncbi:MAG: hypothetical protein EOP88_03005 [Verrucomicrobiaceae bacterium]|nr:MAG: hypothetical protein EOP88_03005 [Verrucomicrobiaceae bacterium]